MSHVVETGAQAKGAGGSNRQVARWNSNVFRPVDVTKIPGYVSPSYAGPARRSETGWLRGSGKKKRPAAVSVPKDSTTDRRAQVAVCSRTPLDRLEVDNRTLLVYPLFSDEESLRRKFLALLNHYQGARGTPELRHDIILAGFLPHPCVNTAARALVASYEYFMGVGSLRLCYSLVAEAVSTLRHEMANHGVSDDLIMSVALVAIVESAKGQRNLLHPSHLRGLMSCFAHHNNAHRNIGVARLGVDYFSGDALTFAIVEGIASPLEVLGQAFYEPQMPGVPGTFSPMMRLNARRIELCIRLPRLVALTRAVRTEIAKGAAGSQVALNVLFERAVALADVLYCEVRDDTAEEALMQETQRLESLQAFSWITKECLVFKSPSLWESMTFYLHARLCTLRLYHFLATSPAANAYMLAKPTLVPELEDETILVGRRILMCADVDVEYGRTLRGPKRSRLRAQSMIAVWGMMDRLPQIDPDREGAPGLISTARRTVVRNWLLEFTVRALGAPECFWTEQDMTDASDMLIGGPYSGSYARLYKVAPGV